MTRAYIPLAVLPAHVAAGWCVVYLVPGKGKHPIVRPAGAVCEYGFARRAG